MKLPFIIVGMLALATPALAQGVDAYGRPLPTTNPQGYPIVSPAQAMANVIRNPYATPPSSTPTPVSGAPLPSAIPPDTIGTHSDGR